jgi:hypothetical protein
MVVGNKPTATSIFLLSYLAAYARELAKQLATQYFVDITPSLLITVTLSKGITVPHRPVTKLVVFAMPTLSGEAEIPVAYTSLSLLLVLLGKPLLA